MTDATGRTAHVDTFVRDRLPSRDLWPQLDWSGVPELTYPDRLNAASDLLDHWIARGDGDRVVFHHADGRWTYRRLLDAANRVAGVLVDDCGLVPGTRVLLRGANQPMLVACWFGVIKAGGVAVTTMPLLRVRELEAIVETAGVRLAISDARVAGDLETALANTAGARLLRFHGSDPDRPDTLESLMARRPTQFANVDTAADDPAIIAFTSGTTGRNKGTVHFHRDLLAVTDTYSRYVLQPSPDDVFIGTPPIAFTYALGGLVLFPMRVGASAALLEQASPPLLVEGIARHRATITVTSPTGYRAMLAHAAGANLSSLRKGVSAGETLPAATFDAWLAATGIRLMDGIGSTELLHMFIGSRAADAKPGSTGTIVPGYEARVVDEAGREVARGVVGRLAVRGPTGCRYLGDIENQRKYVQDGWNLTGDAYIQDADGYFWYQSRTDDMIISAGYNISGAEIENVLLLDPRVAECAVVGVPDEARGQIVKAFIVTSPGTAGSETLVTALQEFVKSQVAPYKYPRAIEFVSELPRTLTGKIQRFRLRDAEKAKSAAGHATATVTIHEPEGWARPSGYANAVSASGRQVFVAGQIGWDPVTMRFPAQAAFLPQVRQALANVAAALAAAGAQPAHVTRMTWYVVDRNEYVDHRKAIGAVYREVFGRHYPAMTLVVVAALIEPEARVEIEATAVVPEA